MDLVPETIPAPTAPWGRFLTEGSSPPTSNSITSHSRGQVPPRRLRSICAFDVVDQQRRSKSGHCLLGEDGRYGRSTTGFASITSQAENGRCWEFAGDPLPDSAVEALSRLWKTDCRRRSICYWTGSRSMRSQACNPASRSGEASRGPCRRPALPVAARLAGPPLPLHHDLGSASRFGVFALKHGVVHGEVSKAQNVKLKTGVGI